MYATASELFLHKVYKSIGSKNRWFVKKKKTIYTKPGLELM